ncbi:hypothetical protein MMPV_003243 [Pyropia vietnamensis]
MAAFVAAASGGRLGARRPAAAAVARSVRQVRVASGGTRRAPMGMVAETPVADGDASAPEVKLVASDEGGDTSMSVVQSMDDVESIISLAAELQMGDLRLSHEGMVLEVTFPGGSGFDADGNLLAPPPPAAAPEPATVVPTAPTTLHVDPVPVVEEEADVPEETPPSESSDDSMLDSSGAVDSDFTVSSNRVGIFFSGAKNKPPLVNVGDHVSFNQPVCIIEQLSAQYVYKSEVSGTVVAVYLEDGDAVEYGQQLMAIRPD